MTSINDNVGFWDSVLIENLTEETFISNIYQRYKRGLIYTYIGAFLVAINPYKPISNYSDDALRTYAKSNYFKLPPHIYGIANLAYRNLQDFNESQCICLLGEKGSGKTESARIILHFLSNVNLKPKLCAEQCSTKLLRCKSLASYPKFEFCDSEFKPERKRSIKYIRKKSTGNIEYDHLYKSLDDVSLSSNHSATCSQTNASVTFKTPNQKINCDDRKVNLSKLLLCDKTPIKAKSSLMTRRDVQCEQCGHIRHNGLPTDNKWSNNAIDRLHDEHLSNKCFKESFCLRTSTNAKNQSPMLCSKTLKTIHSSDANSLLRKRIVYAQVLLESFGNASNEVNSNSSRFGSFFDIELDFKGDPLAAHISCYMVEKSRVTDKAYGERNFHIFYQILSGAEIQLLKMIKLQRNSEKYELLKNDQTTDTDKEDFVYTKKALEVIGLSSDEILAVLKLVSVILKLGNLVFVPTTNIDGTGGCEITNEYELIEIAELLRLDPTILLHCLTKVDTKWSFVDSDSDLDAINASNVRNSLCRTLYGRLFTWIVTKINESLKSKDRTLHGKNFGILDFFGFEANKVNKFEQFIINYCSERLHQSFLQIVMKNQQEVYAKEGLEWSKIDFFDNETICDLVDKNSYGILHLLDEPHIKTDDAFLLRVHQCCAGHPNYLTEENSVLRKSFQIRHFAGHVTYTVSDFVEKNSDKVVRNISLGFYQSKLPIVQSLFPEGNPNRTIRQPSSISSTIRMQLQALLVLLKNRKSHYLFCVKPNESKKSNLFELPLVQHQIRYLSIMPLVNIWRTGYCFALSHANFLNRYKMLHNDTWPFYQKGSTIEGVATIIRGLPLPSAEFILGTTKVFMRSPRTVFEMEDFRRNRLNSLIVLIQTKVRSYLHRKRFLQLRRSQIIIARVWRTWRDCRFGVYTGKRHFWEIYAVASKLFECTLKRILLPLCLQAKENYRLNKFRKIAKWAIDVIQRHYIVWKQRQFLLTLTLRLPANSLSPISNEWITAPCHLTETSRLLQNIFHKWRCYKYRKMFDQVSRNRMREKLTASIIFKNRKISYAISVPHPFLGDYVRLRQNAQWKKLCVTLNDQYIVFADIINKITRSTGKMVPILMALSTNSMLLLDQRTLQIKYRIPATEIYRLSLSPYHDNIAVFHVKASEMGRKKGDFLFQTAHVIEVITKLFLVIQNAVGRQPEVCIDSEFEVTFGNQTVILSFVHKSGVVDAAPHTKITRKGDRMEIIV